MRGKREAYRRGGNGRITKISFSSLKAFETPSGGMKGEALHLALIEKLLDSHCVDVCLCAYVFVSQSLSHFDITVTLDG